MIIGTMLWGTMTSEAEATEIFEAAIEYDICKFDSAQKYPVCGETNDGESERILGRIMASTGISPYVQTKILPDLKPEDYQEAFEKSRENLQVDFIDTVFVHHASRGSYHFREYWNYDVPAYDGGVDESIDALSQLPINKIGLSNETAWALTKWGSYVDVVQNEYSLLHRLAELDIAEVCLNENIEFQAYSPLAYGILANGSERRKVTPNLKNRLTEDSTAAASEYMELAKKAMSHPAAFAVAWVESRKFVTDAVIGPRTVDQLDEICDVVQDMETFKEDIKQLYKKYPLTF